MANLSKVVDFGDKGDVLGYLEADHKQVAWFLKVNYLYGLGRARDLRALGIADHIHPPNC